MLAGRLTQHPVKFGLPATLLFCRSRTIGIKVGFMRPHMHWEPRRFVTLPTSQCPGSKTEVCDRQIPDMAMHGMHLFLTHIRHTELYLRSHIDVRICICSKSPCERRRPPVRWAEARIKIARMTLTIKLDGNWSSFQIANSTPPLCVTDSAIAPSARMANSLSQLTYM